MTRPHPPSTSGWLSNRLRLLGACPKLTTPLDPKDADPHDLFRP